MNARFLLFLCSALFGLPVQAVTAFQDQIEYTYAKNEGVNSDIKSKFASATFRHYHELVNPFSGPVDEAAFLNHIGSSSIGFNYVRMERNLSDVAIEPSGIGYQLQYEHIDPNKPLTASILVGKQSIEDSPPGNILLEGSIRTTGLSIGMYLDPESHINLSSLSTRTILKSGDATFSEDSSASRLQLRYKKVWVKPGKKSYNLEASYVRGKQPINGTSQNSNMKTVQLITDIYFSNQTRVGFGFAKNSADVSDSRTITVRANSYISRSSSVGFAYFNTRFDADIESEKSFLMLYKRLMK